MKKMFSLFVVFLCSVFFITNVVEADVVIESSDFTVFDFLNDDQLINIDNSLSSLNEEGVYNFNACVVLLNNILNDDLSHLVLRCGLVNEQLSFNFNANYYPISVTSGSYVEINLNLSDYSVISANKYSLSTLNVLYKLSDYSLIFWSNDSLFVSSSNHNSVNHSISDEEYLLIPDNYKKYYQFQNFYVADNPLYSIINLRLGNYKGFSSNLKVTYCYDNVCNDNDFEVISYKYGIPEEEIDILEYLSDTRNDYILDISKNYKISAGCTQNLNVYYYSVGIPYTINYYFDDVLQDNLTQNLTGSTGGVIELDDLDLIKNDIYFLDTSKEYKLDLIQGESNIINVYYYSKDVNYNVYIYLDDIFYQSYSYVDVGKVGSTIILDDLEESINIYSLKDGEYKIVLDENSDLNYINVYYYSEFFGSKYQDIDTSDKFYLSFDWVYIKELFNLTGTFTQTEQFIIVYSVNMLFYVIVGLVAYFGLKMLFKLLSIFNMF